MNGIPIDFSRISMIKNIKINLKKFVFRGKYYFLTDIII